MEVFTNHFHELVQAIDDPVVLASKLKQHKYISGTVLNELKTTIGVSKDMKAISLLGPIETFVKLSDEPRKELEKILDLLAEEEGALKLVVNKMRKELRTDSGELCITVIYSKSGLFYHAGATTRQSASSSGVLKKKPDMRQLQHMMYTDEEGKLVRFRLMDRIEPNWKEFAYALNFPHYTVASTGNVSNMFVEWLRGAIEEDT